MTRRARIPKRTLEVGRWPGLGSSEARRTNPAKPAPASARLGELAEPQVRRFLRQSTTAAPAYSVLKRKFHGNLDQTWSSRADHFPEMRIVHFSVHCTRTI